MYYTEILRSEYSDTDQMFPPTIQLISDVDPCGISPCTNGATCSDLGAGEYFCSCPLGYEGDRCETGNYVRKKLEQEQN